MGVYSSSLFNPYSTGSTFYSGISSAMSEVASSNSYIELAADIVSAYVSNNSVPANDLPTLISDVHSALLRVTSGTAVVTAEAPKPAVPAKKSITREFLVCLEDGRKFKS